MPATSAPSTTSPSWVALRSMTTKSPSAAGRSTSIRVAKRSRSASTCSSTSASVSSMSSTSASTPSYVGRVISGLDVDLGGELEGLVVLELGHLDLRLRERLEDVVLERLDVLLRDDLVDRLVEDRAAADLAVDDGRRDLAAAEAGDVDLLGDLLVRRVEARLELLEGHLDGQLGPGRAQGLDGALHRFSPLSEGLIARLWGGASGRQDSNLRSPAPKAGALATTLRPAKWGPVRDRHARGPCLERMTGIEPA